MSPLRVRPLAYVRAVACSAVALVAACGVPEYSLTQSNAGLGGATTTTTNAQGGADAGGAQGTTGGADSANGGGASGGTTATTGSTTTSTLGGTSSTGTATGGAQTETGGTNASLGGSGNAPGTGGAVGTGGAATGGAVGTGGAATGGTVGTGGAPQATGGMAASGGAATGGASTITGGVPATGGAATGGVGISTGGVPATGGAATGGAGVSTGGAATGGAATGGAATGGAATGGAATGGAATGGAATGGAATDPDLVLWYKFDDTAGPTVLDSSGNGRDGTLATLGSGTAVYSTTHQVGAGALNLSSSSATVGGYVVVPTNLQAMGASDAITVACWVRLKTNPVAWERIFDFGSSSTTTSSTPYFYLTPRHNMSTPNAPRSAITTTGIAGENGIMMSTPAAVTTGVWHHFAVVLTAGSPYTGTLYIDNVAVGTNTGMTLHPSDLGATTNNWLGRSQFAVDPLFNGYLDDFRVYKRALTATEIDALYAVR